jgi:hypothetical protein
MKKGVTIMREKAAGQDPNSRIVRGSAAYIVKQIRKGGLLEDGGHHMCVYDSVKSFSEIYSEYAAANLSRNEVVLVATQYESIEKVKENLAAKGIDVQKHMREGTLLIIDAQHGYFGPDVMGAYKMALTVIARIKKEKRRGLTWFGSVDSFYAFDSIPEMIDYETFFAPKWDTPLLKAICSHHAENFGMLSEKQMQRLFDTHVKSIMVHK